MCLQLSSRRYLGIVKPQQLARSLARSLPPARRSQFFSSMRLSLQRQRALIAGGLAEEPHGKSCVACVEFPAWCQHGVYLSECHTRPSRAASPAPSAAQTAQGKRLAGGNEARADLHLLGWTTTTSIANSRCHGEHHSTALPPFAHLEDGGNNPHHLFARLL
ncbi:hypothetical protein IHE44_0003719 [Lamprotornis superbus]|uniref:Uncharacterized protein n=1 Tax=Lamprotornis superbus TaxID=245042 RepID=A0A835TVL9_9PASS|nr:hypothetical protein IHE44_0003719 [Lamprotornis superbus]